GVGERALRKRRRTMDGHGGKSRLHTGHVAGILAQLRLNVSKITDLFIQRAKVIRMEQQEGSAHLDRSIGLGRVLFQSIAAMGPGASIALGLGLIVSYA